MRNNKTDTFTTAYEKDKRVRRKKSEAVIGLLLLILLLSLTGCGKNPFSPGSENRDTELSTEQEAEENAADLPEEVLPLPEKVLSEEALLQEILDLIRENRTEVHLEYRLGELGREEAENLLDEVLQSDNLYMQYYIETMRFQTDYPQIQKQDCVRLDITAVYYEDCVEWEQIRHIKTYEEAYQMFSEGYQTGFEKLVFIPEGEIAAEGEAGITKVKYLPEEVAWNESLQMPYAARQPLYITFTDSEENTLLVASMEYDCYGLTREDQIEAQKQVAEKVQEMADRILEQVPQEDEKARSIAVYNLVQKQVQFDWWLNDALLQYLERNEPEIATGRGLYGALIDGKSVCSGYACAFDRICKALGMNSWVVSGYAENGDHAWNVVLCQNGELLYFDPTWGDSAKWHDTYVCMSEKTQKSENRRVYDFFYIPQEFKEAGFDYETAPPCLYD